MKTDHQTTHAQGCWDWGPRHYECALREIEALRAEDDAWCAECGVKLENVRPGKHQHPTCSQAALQRPAAVAQPLTDEALLRQALEALELRCGTNAEERNELIPALRERLGVKA